MKNQVQLITYVDRFSGGGINDVNNLLTGPLQGVFGGIHLLPFFYPIDGADTGFDPINHSMVDKRLGDWSDIKNLSKNFELVSDLIVNHISSQSEEFQDFLEKGKKSKYSKMFITFDRVFSEGATEKELLDIYRPRPNLPFNLVVCKDGSKKIIWTTFTPQQIDIDVESSDGKNYLRHIMQTFAANGIKMLRLDAVGYAIKRKNSSCFMLPETFEFIDYLTREAKNLGMEVLVEVHSYYKTQIEIARHVDWVYDFALPPLILHSLFTSNSEALKNWLKISPRNCITVLDTHDGIGVIDIGADSIKPNSPGLVPPEAINNLVETIHAKSGGISREATGEGKSNLDLYQVNCGFYDALGRDDTDYLLARLLQFFSPGIPQVYYMGLLAGENDVELFHKTGSGRNLNRRIYKHDQVIASLNKPVVQLLIKLIKFRNNHPAFIGEFSLPESKKNEIILCWESDNAAAKLEVNLETKRFVVTATHNNKEHIIEQFHQF